MKTVLRWLTRNRFTWSDLLLGLAAFIPVVNSSLPTFAKLAICGAAGLLIAAITELLRMAAGGPAKSGGA